jgi:hypothetical protein
MAEQKKMNREGIQNDSAGNKAIRNGQGNRKIENSIGNPGEIRTRVPETNGCTRRSPSAAV